MIKLTLEMKEMIKKELSFIATADKRGKPNVVPKGSLKVLDDQTLLYTEGTSSKTWENLGQNPLIAVVVANRERINGYQFKGKATLVDKGPLFEEAVEARRKRGRPKPKAAVKIRIEEIYSLKTKKRIA